MRCPGWPCDTEHAINPRIWVRESETFEDAIVLAERIIRQCEEDGSKHVCYTGGEPFLQDHDGLLTISQLLNEQNLSIEVFTNGSYVLPEWALKGIDVMMDWKLRGSGEAESHREERLLNAVHLKPSDGIKFVVKDFDDVLEAFDVNKTLNTRARVWIGRTWESRLVDRDLVQWLINNKLDWSLNVQVHKFIWEPDKRGV
jgi:7-carboxy-7-deazaguanine synthase